MQMQFVEWSMLVIVDKDPTFDFAKQWLNPHIDHNLRGSMDLASVIATLGVVNENQISTSGTINILKEAAKYCNHGRVSFLIIYRFQGHLGTTKI